MPRNNVRKYVPSVKVVSKSIDKNWEYNFETNMFSHPMYPNKKFKPLCYNKKKEELQTKTDKYGKKHSSKKIEIISTLYPHIPADEDPRNIGFNLTRNNSSQSFDVVSNKMQSFWDTRRGKRYISYVAYRKQRDANKKIWLENNPVKTNEKKGKN